VADPADDNFATAIDVLPALQGDADFAALFLRFLAVEATSWIQSFWLLKMMQRVELWRLPPRCSDAAWRFVERCAFSRCDKLQEAARATVCVLPPPALTALVEALVLRLDAFDSAAFEQTTTSSSSKRSFPSSSSPR
jgi:hypothetical protein